jgi:hypothetical protein
MMQGKGKVRTMKSRHLDLISECMPGSPKTCSLTALKKQFPSPFWGLSCQPQPSSWLCNLFDCSECVSKPCCNCKLVDATLHFVGAGCVVAMLASPFNPGVASPSLSPRPPPAGGLLCLLLLGLLLLLRLRGLRGGSGLATPATSAGAATSFPVAPLPLPHICCCFSGPPSARGTCTSRRRRRQRSSSSSSNAFGGPTGEPWPCSALVSTLISPLLSSPLLSSLSERKQVKASSSLFVLRGRGEDRSCRR